MGSSIGPADLLTMPGEFQTETAGPRVGAAGVAFSP